MQTIEGIEVGQLAPDFRLKSPEGPFVTLSEHAGKRNVVLVFYPLAFSPVCAHQLPQVQAMLPELEALETTVFGISVDSHFANAAFARQIDISFTLLSDFRREAAAAYGVLIGELGVAWRSVFVVNKQGRVVYKDLSLEPDDPNLVPSIARVVEALRAMR